MLTGSPIEIHPSFNPMIGPSPYVLINMGARYQPCMHNMANIQNASTNIVWPCPNATTTTGSSVSCTLSELCGMGGVPNPHINGNIDETPAPNQWWRFITPIFLHAGIVHIGFNLLLQLTLGRDMERSIGPVRFTLVYFSSGIFGFVLGGNFAATGIASTGCSGSLFGIMALTLLELLYTWRERPSPIKDLLFILVDVIISFILGLLPGLDNFSHIGGFLMGLVLGVCVLRSPNALRRRTGEDEPPYTTVGMTGPGATPDAASQGIKHFIRQPLGFFKGRRAMWWFWWLARAAALIGVIIGFILLLKNFYVWRSGCSWCKYLSCLVSVALFFPCRYTSSNLTILLAGQQLVQRRQSVFLEFQQQQQQTRPSVRNTQSLWQCHFKEAMRNRPPQMIFITKTNHTVYTLGPQFLDDSRYTCHATPRYSVFLPTRPPLVQTVYNHEPLVASNVFSFLFTFDLFNQSLHCMTRRPGCLLLRTKLLRGTLLSTAIHTDKSRITLMPTAQPQNGHRYISNTGVAAH